MKIPKYRKAAAGQPCVRCGADDGTVCLRHYEGFRKKDFGKGMGIKCHDFAAADLCVVCDNTMSTLYGYASDAIRGIGMYDPELKEELKTLHSEEWLYLCLKTVIRRYEQGVIK